MDSEQETRLTLFEVEPDEWAEADGSAPRWQPWPSRQQTQRWMQRHWRACSAWAALLLVVLSLAGVMPAPPLPASPSALVAIRMQNDGLSCLQSLTWSPDSRRVAMLGYRQECPMASGVYQRSLLDIYSADSGHLLREIEPDEAIFQALQRDAGVPPTADVAASPIIYFTAVLWSGQTRQLALTFSIWKLPRNQTLEGVLLMNDAGEQMRVFLQAQPTLALYDEWDLQDGQLVAAHFTAPEFSLFFANLPTASGYRWGANGAIMPDHQSSPYKIGNPIGDAAFSFWQPGQAYLLTSNGNTIEKPGVYFWQSSFTAWSPDGRYLIQSLYVAGRLAPAGVAPPSAQTLADFDLRQAPVVPVRDAAMLRLLHVVQGAPTEPAQSVSLAWHPGGHVLAASGLALDLGLVVNLYDAATGRLLVSFPTITSGESPQLLWSPDGTRLMLMVGPAATIWQPHLPAWLS
jgi:hypothetical protein